MNSFLRALSIFLLTITINAAYNSSGALNKNFQSAWDTNDYFLGLTFTMHSVPSIFTSVGVGAVIDRFGVSSTLIVLQLLCLAGFTVNLFADSDTIYLVGRLLYGLGAEAVLTVQVKLIASWFKPRAQPALFAALYAYYCVVESVFITLMSVLGLTSSSNASGAQSDIDTSAKLLWVLNLLAVFATIAVVFEERRISSEGAEEEKDSEVVDNPKSAAILVSAARILFMLAYTCLSNLIYDICTQFFKFSEISAATAFSTLQFSTLSGVVWGMLVPRVGSRRTMTICAIVLSSVMAVLRSTPPKPVVYAALCLAGVAMGGCGGQSTSALALIVGKERAGTAVGATFSIQFAILAGFLPAMTKFAAVSGYGNTLLVLFGACLLSTLLFLVVSLDKSTHVARNRSVVAEIV